ncbi:hypothetical protein OF001_U20244 [Pseudomonas sp. OF001]|uniref:hypothetical protein n=1 Tax=Pseudomonas sp. OF001 TaxID=2772300 RepID=UPI00191804DF|nr:hypothetical protein [Pseudomonas sp. OF001]CAD5377317.1 hypothetical protein OF001_U20244 [Pseudomonas sp. OF001]
MSYAVICDARAGESLGIQFLALVDRSRSRKQWWTSDDPSIAINYRSLSAARYAARRLHHNNARVVPFQSAVKWLREQAKEILHNEALSACEAGWDAHKDSF